MKPFIVLALVFNFVVTHIRAADNTTSNSSTTSQASTSAPKGKAAPSHSAVPARKPAAIGARARSGSAADFRRNYPTALQSVQRERLAMISARVARNSQTMPPSTMAAPAQQTGAAKSKPAKTGSNPQATMTNRRSYADALNRCRREHHDRNWWKRHCETIVFVNTGYYYLNTGYWYPAYGYDPAYSYTDYDGPIYTYGNLLPDQVIVNVQLALQEIGYYVGPITGSLGPATRAALANFQRDYGLVITAAVDEPTVQTLGLI